MVIEHFTIHLYLTGAEIVLNAWHNYTGDQTNPHPEVILSFA